MIHQADPGATKAYLYRLLQQQADKRSMEWLDQQSEKLGDGAADRHLFLAFGMASRFFGKENLQLSEEDIAEAEQLRKGFQPQYWTVLQTARAYLLLFLSRDNATDYTGSLDKLFETADMEEQQALYGALPLLDHPEALRMRASEGIRTNITGVFDAIALHNPYPAGFLDEAAWNQMLLKAVFMQRPLYKIYGADERANPELARMLVDFAHERWAAGRRVMPELWRFVGPYINEKYLPDLEKTLTTGDSLEAEACLLACTLSPSPQAKELLAQYPGLKGQAVPGQVNWQSIGERFALQ